MLFVVSLLMSLPNEKSRDDIAHFFHNAGMKTISALHKGEKNSLT